MNYKIVHKKGKFLHEVHCRTMTDVKLHVAVFASEAVTMNRGFVFMEDVGATKQSIKFNDGETVNVTLLEGVS